MIRSTNSPAGAQQKLAFEYDWQGRQIRKQFFTYSGGWAEQSDLIFLYDGWNLEAELNGNASKAPVRLYMWGADLSGTPYGAGGIGGLLLVEDYSTWIYSFMVYDGNGNVGALVHTGTGVLKARYDYGPFGELIRATGPAASVNPIRFSTKFTDAESGMVYHGERYLNPSTGRWLSHDPAEEDEGGPGLYGMVQNDAINGFDPFGLWSSSDHIELTCMSFNDAMRKEERNRAVEARLRDGLRGRLASSATLITGATFGLLATGLLVGESTHQHTSLLFTQALNTGSDTGRLKATSRANTVTTSSGG